MCTNKHLDNPGRYASVVPVGASECSSTSDFSPSAQRRPLVALAVPSQLCPEDRDGDPGFPPAGLPPLKVPNEATNGLVLRVILIHLLSWDCALGVVWEFHLDRTLTHQTTFARAPGEVWMMNMVYITHAGVREPGHGA